MAMTPNNIQMLKTLTELALYDLNEGYRKDEELRNAAYRAMDFLRNIGVKVD